MQIVATAAVDIVWFKVWRTLVLLAGVQLPLISKFKVCNEVFNTANGLSFKYHKVSSVHFLPSVSLHETLDNGIGMYT